MTLSDITGETRAVLKWGTLLLGALIILFLLLKIKDIVFPPAPPKPTVGFGKLPQIEFPATARKNLTFSINTITGTLPTLAATEKVFKMRDTRPDLLSLDRAKEKVKIIGFEGNPTKVSENVYQWKNPDGRTLTMNILDFNFNLSSDFLSKENIPAFGRRADIAIGVSKDFLGQMDLFSKDLDETKTATNLFSIKDFKLIPATSLSNTQIVKVNFFQKDFNNLPVYYPGETTDSPMSFFVGESENPQVLEANFFYQNTSEISSTYPLKTTEKVLEDLKEGKGYILSSGGSSNISIKKVNLGYYIGEKKQEYLIPIVVFEGDNFLAYINAVTDEWVDN